MDVKPIWLLTWTLLYCIISLVSIGGDARLANGLEKLVAAHRVLDDSPTLLNQGRVIMAVFME
jgi:hypothetical protein